MMLGIPGFIPRMDLPFFMTPQLGSSSMQHQHNLPAPQPPTLTGPPPPAFVDLPLDNSLISRGHIFAGRGLDAISASVGASAAAAAVAGDVTRMGEHDQLFARMLHFSDNLQASREIHMLMTNGLAAGGESAPVGATQNDIDKHTTKSKWRCSGDEVDPCTVCMCEFEEDDEVRSLPCAHAFHSRCIDRWLSYNKKCPNCRVDLDRNASPTGSSSAAAPDVAAAAAAQAAAAADAAIAAAAAAVAANPVVDIDNDILENAPWNERAREALGTSEEVTVNTSMALPVVSAAVSANTGL
ncbi:hypothetical protein PFISCL1PPCAC_18616 [Pristionchus fissidentatus]|uniref:RING-type domain-containing protein n=1 Tax=Pristionchus fissidentatus TaxID=1538716 RepID=A0AAV5W5T1_9BILA|nr:hypothetical protein PFISCL1PPCAC_18616 [Pristionchus fissidentatus]